MSEETALATVDTPAAAPTVDEPTKAGRKRREAKDQAPEAKPMPEPPIRAIRRAGVSLLAIETTDPAATMQTTIKGLNGKAQECPILKWNLLDGLQGMNQAGNAYTAEVSPDGAIQTGNPAECLSVLAKKPPGSPEARALVFMLGAARIIQDGQGYNPAVVQGIWNLRDTFKANGATLVLLSPGFSLPPELARDVVTIAEPMPDKAQLATITDSLCQDAGIAPPVEPERAAVLDTLTGLGAFEAEQTLALSITKAGIDRAGLWGRKVKAIESTPGLTVYRGRNTLDDYAGGENAKRLFGDTLKGALRCTCLVFIDEADKGMAAAGTDTSGTTQDQSKAILTYTQDNDVLGATALGPPGTGKSYLMKCLAGEYGVPLVMLDLGALKGSLVGQSEQNTRAAIKIIHAISEGRALWVIACNRDQGLPPEFRRRFSYLTMFFDLPDRAEKDAAWKLHTTRLQFQGQTFSLRPDQTDRTGLNDDGWTGAEIRNACLKAYAMDTTLLEAARSIVPVSKSAAEAVLASRKGASGRYISASKPGVYTYTDNQAIQPATGRRMEAE